MTRSADERKNAPTQASTPKKPWTAPRLVAFGDLRRLTQARNRAGKDSSTNATGHYSL